MPDLSGVLDEARAIIAARQPQNPVAATTRPTAPVRPTAPDILVKPPPMRTVSDAEVREVIAGTVLADVVRAVEYPVEDGLPTAVAVVKALALMGVTLSRQADPPTTDHMRAQWATMRGASRGRLVIDTACGQLCNVWGLVSMPSGCGKDIGGVVPRLASALGCYIGSGGSAEGIADAMADDDHPGLRHGLLTIGELQPYLDSKSWQNKAQGFLNESFNAGFFAVRMSSRAGQSKARECAYAAPSILANVQPEILSEIASETAIANGFLNRFLVAHVPDARSAIARAGDDAGRMAHRTHEDARHGLAAVGESSGRVRVPSGYQRAFMDEYDDAKRPLRGHYGRLWQEYYPRLALMLTFREPVPRVDPAIDERAWAGAETLIRYYYAQACVAYESVGAGSVAIKRMRLMDRVLGMVKLHGGAITMRDLARGLGGRVGGMEREEAVRELVAHGLVAAVTDGPTTVIALPERVGK